MTPTLRASILKNLRGQYLHNEDRAISSIEPTDL